MIIIKDKKIEMSGQVQEIVEDIALIKITLIDELGQNKSNLIYELANKLVETQLDYDLYDKLEINLPHKIAKKLIKLWKGK